MARQYRMGVVRRMINRLVARRVRSGGSVGDVDTRLLTTVGRRTGLERTNPVTLVEMDGHLWLVAPYGEVSWVHNLRAAGSAELSRGSETLRFRAVEVPAAEAAPVLKHYLTRVKVVRPFFDVGHDDPVGAFEEIAPQKPVFRIEAFEPA